MTTDNATYALLNDYGTLLKLMAGDAAAAQVLRERYNTDDTELLSRLLYMTGVLSDAAYKDLCRAVRAAPCLTTLRDFLCARYSVQQVDALWRRSEAVLREQLLRVYDQSPETGLMTTLRVPILRIDATRLAMLGSHHVVTHLPEGWTFEGVDLSDHRPALLLGTRGCPKRDDSLLILFRVRQALAAVRGLRFDTAKAEQLVQELKESDHA